MALPPDPGALDPAEGHSSLRPFQLSPQPLTPGDDTDDDDDDDDDDVNCVSFSELGLLSGCRLGLPTPQTGVVYMWGEKIVGLYLPDDMKNSRSRVTTAYTTWVVVRHVGSSTTPLGCRSARRTPLTAPVLGRHPERVRRPGRHGQSLYAELTQSTRRRRRLRNSPVVGTVERCPVLDDVMSYGHLLIT